jgi:hypothetical protein
MVIAIEFWGISALLCLIMAFGARTQPIPAFIDGLGICEGKPCYLNILPDKTHWDEAQSMLASFPEIKRSVTTTDFYDLPGFHGRLLLIPNQDGFIQEIDLSPSDSLTYIGSAFLQLGDPCAAVRLGRDDLGLIYPGISIIARMHKVANYFVVRPTSPVVQANLFKRVESCSDIGLDRTQADFRWHGFARYAENGD